MTNYHHKADLSEEGNSRVLFVYLLPKNGKMFIYYLLILFDAYLFLLIMERLLIF